MDLAFLVDITHELNVLNKNLQGQGQLVSDNVRAFFSKPVFGKAQLSQTTLCQFPTCKALMDSDTLFSDEYADTIVKLQGEFDHRFADIKTHRATFQLFVDTPSPLMGNMPPLCYRWSQLTCIAILNAKPSSGGEMKNRQAWTFFERISPHLSSAFQDVQVDHAFFAVPVFVKSSSPQWTLISLV